MKFQPIYSGEDLVNSASHLNLNGEKKNQFEILPDTTEELELDPEIEPEEEPELDSEQEPESSFPAGDVFDELSERESSNIENVDEGGEKHQLTRRFEFIKATRAEGACKVSGDERVF